MKKAGDYLNLLFVAAAIILALVSLYSMFV